MGPCERSINPFNQVPRPEVRLNQTIEFPVRGLRRVWTLMVSETRREMNRAPHGPEDP